MPTNTITIPTHELLTVDIPNACRMLGIGRTKLHEMMASGQVRAIRIAGRTLIDVASMRALVGAAEPWKPAGAVAALAAARVGTREIPNSAAGFPPPPHPWRSRG